VLQLTLLALTLLAALEKSSGLFGNYFPLKAFSRVGVVT